MVVMIENDWKEADLFSYFCQSIERLKQLKSPHETQEIAYYKMDDARVFFFNDIYAFATADSKVTEIYVVRPDKAKIQYVNTVECSTNFKPLAKKIREYFAVLHTVISNALSSKGVRYIQMPIGPEEFRALLLKENSI